MAFTKLFDAIFYGGAQRNRLLKLDTPLGEDWLLPLYAKGAARIGRDYEFIVDTISSHGEDIDLTALIGKPVTLWLQQTDGSYLPHHGYVHAFSRLGADGFLTMFQLRFSSWMHFLRLRRDMRDWQEQSGPMSLTRTRKRAAPIGSICVKPCHGIPTACNGNTTGISSIELWRKQARSAASSKRKTVGRIR
jgi:hypothetical protein